MPAFHPKNRLPKFSLKDFANNKVVVAQGKLLLEIILTAPS
jgi:hypothetical protein